MISALLSGETGWAGVAVYGFVRDAETDEPLPGVAVTLDDGALWAVSGVDGRYELKNVPKGEYLLGATLIGYEGFQRKIKIDGTAAIRCDIQLSSIPETNTLFLTSGAPSVSFITRRR